MLGVDPLVLLDDHAAVLVGDVEARDFTAQALGHELKLRAFRLQREVIEHEEVREICSGVRPIDFSRIVTGILRRRSTRKYRMSFGSNSKSSHEPR